MKPLPFFFASILILTPFVQASLDEPGKAQPQDFTATPFTDTSSTLVSSDDTRMSRGGGDGNTACVASLGQDRCILIRTALPGGAAQDVLGRNATTPGVFFSYELYFCTEAVISETVTLDVYLNVTRAPTVNGNLFTTTQMISDTGAPAENCNVDITTIGTHVTLNTTKRGYHAPESTRANTGYWGEISTNTAAGQVRSALFSTSTNLGLKAKATSITNNTVITGSTTSSADFLIEAETGYCLPAAFHANNCSIASGEAGAGAGLPFDGGLDGSTTNVLFNLTFNLTLGNEIIQSTIVQADKNGYASLIISLPTWTRPGLYKLAVQGSYGYDRSNGEAFIFVVRPITTRLQSMTFDTSGNPVSITYPTPYNSNQALYFVGDVANAQNADVTSLIWQWGNSSVQTNTNMAKNLNATQPAQGVSYQLVTTIADSELPTFRNEKQFSLNLTITTSGPNGMSFGGGTALFETGCNLGSGCASGVNAHNDGSVTDGNYSVIRVASSEVELQNIEAKLDRIEPKVNSTWENTTMIDTLKIVTGVDVWTWIFLYGAIIAAYTIGFTTTRVSITIMIVGLCLGLTMIYAKMATVIGTPANAFFILASVLGTIIFSWRGFALIKKKPPREEES